MKATNHNQKAVDDNDCYQMDKKMMIQMRRQGERWNKIDMKMERFLIKLKEEGTMMMMMMDMMIVMIVMVVMIAMMMMMITMMIIFYRKVSYEIR